MDLSSYRVTGTNNDGKQVSVTRWNNLLSAIESGSGEAVYLADHGVVGDGTTVNSASAVNTVLAALTRGAEVIFPSGTCLFDGEIQVTQPVIMRGSGSSSYSSVADGDTVLRFPAGSNGIVFLANGGTGAQRSSLRDLTIYAVSASATTATANYSTAAPTTITITGGTNDYAVNQCVRLEGAGPSYTMVGKTIATTNGSNVVTVTSVGGNPGVYVGQHISGAGIPAGTTVTAWDSTTITLSANCTATASGVAYTVKYPLISRISAINGSTITLNQTPTQTQNVTGGVLKHADTAIYADCTLDTDHVQAGSNFHIGMFLHGESNNGQIADNGNFKASNFGGNWAGVVCWGFDAQVNNFWGCNLSFPEVQFLDISLIGNYLWGCHFAFNIGIAVPLGSSYAAMFGCYFEGGTSYLGNNSATYAFGCTGLRNGSGWLMYGATDDLTGSGNAPALINKTSSGSIQYADIYASRVLLSSSTDYRARIENAIGSAPVGSTGIGLELGVDGSSFRVLGFNRTSNARIPVILDGSTIPVAPDGTTVGTFDTGGLDLASGKTIEVNGTQVLSARKTGWSVDSGTAKRTANTTYSGTAEAAYTQATIQALMDAVRDLSQTVKALKDDLHGTAGHGLIGT